MWTGRVERRTEGGGTCPGPQVQQGQKGTPGTHGEAGRRIRPGKAEQRLCLEEAGLREDSASGKRVYANVLWPTGGSWGADMALGREQAA